MRDDDLLVSEARLLDLRFTSIILKMVQDLFVSFKYSIPDLNKCTESFKFYQMKRRKGFLKRKQNRRERWFQKILHIIIKSKTPCALYRLTCLQLVSVISTGHITTVPRYSWSADRWLDMSLPTS